MQFTDYEMSYKIHVLKLVYILQLILYVNKLFSSLYCHQNIYKFHSVQEAAVKYMQAAHKFRSHTNRWIITVHHHR